MEANLFHKLKKKIFTEADFLCLHHSVKPYEPKDSNK